MLGVIIISHGSKSSQWKNQVAHLIHSIKLTLSDDFSDNLIIEQAYLEYHPFLYNAVNNLIEKGIEEILVIPLFICPSVHLSIDIPVLLKLKTDSNREKILTQSGNELIDNDVNITLGSSLFDTDVIPEILANRIEQISESPSDEAVLLLSHGSSSYKKYWDKLNERVTDTIRRTTNIKEIKYSYIQTGKTFAVNAMPLISSIAEQSKRALVFGIYLANNIKSIAEKYAENELIGNHKILDHPDIYFSDKSLLPDNSINTLIINQIKNATGNTSAI